MSHRPVPVGTLFLLVAAAVIIIVVLGNMLS